MYVYTHIDKPNYKYIASPFHNQIILNRNEIFKQYSKQTNCKYNLYQLNIPCIQIWFDYLVEQG